MILLQNLNFKILKKYAIFKACSRFVFVNLESFELGDEDIL